MPIEPMRIEIDIPDTSSDWGKTWKSVMLIVQECTHPLDTHKNINILNLTGNKNKNYWRYSKEAKNVRF